MTEETMSEQQAQVAEGQQSTTPEVVTETSATTQQATNATATQQAETFDRAYVEKLRKEAADYRTRATAAEAKVKESDDAKLSELELAKKRADEAEARAQEHERQLKSERLRGAVERTAARLGFANAEIAGRLIDQAAISYDAEGNPANVEALLQQVLTDNPYLRGAQSGGAMTNAATRGQAEPAKTYAQQRDAIYGSGLNPFDPAVARANGGGVYAPDPSNTARPAS